MASLADAINVTGATSGKVVSWFTTPPFILSAAQRTALVTFVQSLGTAWPGAAGHIWTISLNRADGAPQTVQCTVGGLVVHNDATAAVQAATQQGVQIVGIAP